MEAVTIIAGFKGFDGVVVCSDTQETVEHLKRSVSKLRFEPEDGKSEMAVAFCGAGDGPFIDKTIERAWEDAQTANSLDEACAEIEKSIKETHVEYGRIFQRGYLPSIELIYGVKMHSDSKLFHAVGPVVNERECCAAGQGLYMADFLTSRMYKDYLDVRACLILAAYVLFQAKEHVDGCGGESHIAVLRDRAPSGKVNANHIKELTELLTFADHDVGSLLIACGDLKESDANFRNYYKGIMGGLETFRANAKKSIKDNAEFMKTLFPTIDHPDDLGIPKPNKKAAKRLKQLASQMLKQTK
jgi:20S proteasome alpha/beta subunit